ncbi:unnamed protein product [Chrysoparadoxa australica]
MRFLVLQALLGCYLARVRGCAQLPSLPQQLTSQARPPQPCTCTQGGATVIVAGKIRGGVLAPARSPSPLKLFKNLFQGITGFFRTLIDPRWKERKAAKEKLRRLQEERRAKERERRMKPAQVAAGAKGSKRRQPRIHTLSDVDSKKSKMPAPGG